MADSDVCYKCVLDRFLGGQIQRNGVSTCCSLCGSKRKCLPLSKIVTRVEAILAQYICEGEVDFRLSGHGSEQYQKGEAIDIWVSEIFDCDNVEPIVKAVCRKLTSYSDDVNYSRLPFSPDDIGHQWGEFQEGMKHGNRFFNESAKGFLDWLFKGLDNYPVSSSEEAVVRTLTPKNAPQIYRARTCITSESFDEILASPARNLAAPPKDRAGEGRMNPAGVPAFYGALERLTCIAELRPPVGGTVVSGEFKLNREVRVLDFARLESAYLGPEPSFFDPKYFAKAGRREFLRYLHGEITLPVLPRPGEQLSYDASHCRVSGDSL